MSVSSVERPVSALRQRMLEDMSMRGLRSDTQRDYVRGSSPFGVGSGPGVGARPTPARRSLGSVKC